jgi:hypothetical protein
VRVPKRRAPLAADSAPSAAGRFPTAPLFLLFVLQRLGTRGRNFFGFDTAADFFGSGGNTRSDRKDESISTCFTFFHAADYRARPRYSCRPRI